MHMLCIFTLNVSALGWVLQFKPNYYVIALNFIMPSVVVPF
jgi:hypothetical protein